MLEGFFSDVLTRCLGDYIQNISPDRMKVFLWGGCAEISTVEIRSEALRKLELPVVIKEGYIGTVRITIPWNSLGSKPIVLELENIILIATPKESETWNEEDETKRTQAEKQLLIEKFDLDALAKRQHEQQGFSSEFMNKLFDNIQLRISGFHLRFESTTKDNEKGFCCGVTIVGCKLENTDSTFMPCFSTDKNFIFKLLMIQDLAVYWNVGGEPMKYNSAEELCDKLKMQIAQKGKRSIDGLNYILEPLSTSVKITINRKGPTTTTNTSKEQSSNGPECTESPSVDFSVLLATMMWQITPTQIISITEFIEEFTYSRKRIPFLKFRPLVSVKDNPRAWLLYAVNAVLVDYRSRKACSRSDAITKRHQQRLEYISLYQTPQEERHPEAQRRLEALENELNANDIIIFRVWGRRDSLFGSKEGIAPNATLQPSNKLTSEEQKIQQQLLQSAPPAAVSSQDSTSGTILADVLGLCDTQAPWLRDVVYGILCGCAPPPLVAALSPSNVTLRIGTAMIKLGTTYSYIEGVCCDLSFRRIKGTIRSLCIGEKRKRHTARCELPRNKSNHSCDGLELGETNNRKVTPKKQFIENEQSVDNSKNDEEIDYIYTYGEHTDLKVPRLSQKIQMALEKMTQDRKEKEAKEKIAAEREAAERLKREQEEQERKKREDAAEREKKNEESSSSRFSSLFSFINRNILLNDSSSEEEDDDASDDSDTTGKIDPNGNSDASKEVHDEKSSGSSFMKSFDRLKSATLNFAEAKVKSVTSQLAVPAKEDTEDFQELTDMPGVIESQFEQLTKEKPFLLFEFTLAPDTTKPDYALQVSTTQPITVIYNKQWTENTCKFIIENFTAAGKVLTAFTGSDLVRELDMALTETKTFAVNVNIFSPKVYVPIVSDEITASDSYLLLDFGTFHCTTAPASVLSALGKKFMQSGNIDVCDSSELIKELDSKDLFYDLFTMQLANVQVSLVNLKTELVEQAATMATSDNTNDGTAMRLRWKKTSESQIIVEPFNLYANLLVNLLPLNVKLPLFCASVLLPQISVNLSTDQLYMLSRQVDYYVIETIDFVESISTTMMNRREHTHFTSKSRKSVKRQKEFDPLATLKESEVMVNIEHAKVMLTSSKDNRTLVSSTVNGFSLTKKTKVKSACMGFSCKDFEVIDHLTPSKDPKCPNFLVTSRYTFDENTTFKAVDQDLFLSGQVLFSSSPRSSHKEGLGENESNTEEVITANVYLPNISFFVHPETIVYFLLYFEKFGVPQNRNLLSSTDINTKQSNPNDRSKGDGAAVNSRLTEQREIYSQSITSVPVESKKKVSLTFSASSASMFLFCNETLVAACVGKECCATITPEREKHTKINFVLPIIFCFDVQKTPTLVITAGDEKCEKQMRKPRIIAEKITSMKKKTRSAVERIERRTEQTVPLTTNDCVVISIDAYPETQDGRTSDAIISFNRLAVNPKVLILLQPLVVISDLFSVIPSNEHNISVLVRHGTVSLSPDYRTLGMKFRENNDLLDNKIDTIEVNLEDFSFHLRVDGDELTTVQNISTFGKVDVFAVRSMHEMFPLIQQTQIKTKAVIKIPRGYSDGTYKKMISQENVLVQVELEKVRINAEQSYLDGFVCTLISTIDFIEQHFQHKSVNESAPPPFDLQLQVKLLLFTFEAYDETTVSSSIGFHSVRVHLLEKNAKDVDLLCTVSEVKIKDFLTNLVVLSRTSLEKMQQDAISLRLSDHRLSFSLSEILLTPSVPELFTNAANVVLRTTRFLETKGKKEVQNHRNGPEVPLCVTCSFDNINVFFPASPIRNGVDFSGVLLTFSGSYETEQIEESTIHKALLHNVHFSRRDIFFYPPSCLTSNERTEVSTTTGVQEISPIHPLLQPIKKMFIAPYRYLFTKSIKDDIITFVDCSSDQQDHSIVVSGSVKENTFTASSSMLIAPFSVVATANIPFDYSSGAISDIRVIVGELRVTACPSDAFLCADGIISILREFSHVTDKQETKQKSKMAIALPQLTVMCSSLGIELASNTQRSLRLFRLRTGLLGAQGNSVNEKYLLSTTISDLLCESFNTTQLKWEPTVEHWSANLFIKLDTSSHQTETQKEQTAEIDATLESRDTLNVNITQTVIKDVSLCFSGAYKIRGEMEHLVQFENRIGAPVGITVAIDIDGQLCTATSKLKFNETKCLRLNNKYLVAFSHLSFDVALETAVVLSSRVHSSPRRSGKFQSIATALTTTWKQLSNGIIQRVSFEQGTPRITFDSPYVVQNATDVCIEVMFDLCGVQTHSSQIAPGTAWGIAPTMLPKAQVQQTAHAGSSAEDAQCDARFRFCYGDDKTSEWFNVSFCAPARHNLQNAVVTVRYDSGTTTITISSYLKLVNFLPFGVSFVVLNEGAATKPGERPAIDPLSLSHRDCSVSAGCSKRVMLAPSATVCLSIAPQHQEKCLSTPMQLHFYDAAAHLPCTMQLDINLSSGKRMVISAHEEVTDGALCLTLFAPFLVANNTGLPLAIANAEKTSFGVDPRASSAGDSSGKQPLLLFDPLYHSTKRVLTVKTDTTDYSEQVDLGGTGVNRTISLKTQNEKGPAQEIPLSINVSTVHELAPFTHLITISPGIVLINDLDTDLFIKQENTEKLLILERGTIQNLVWQESSKPKRIAVRPRDSNDGSWSCYFSPEESKSFCIKLVAPHETKSFAIPALTINRDEQPAQQKGQQVSVVLDGTQVPQRPVQSSRPSTPSSAASSTSSACSSINELLALEDDSRTCVEDYAWITSSSNNFNTVVSFKQCTSRRLPAYRIDNRTKRTLVLTQRGCTETTAIYASQSLYYCWEDNEAPVKQLQVDAVLSSDETVHYSMPVEPDKLDRHVSLSEAKYPQCILAYSVEMSGTLKVLTITDQSTQDNDADADASLDLKKKASAGVAFSVKLTRIGLSLVGSDGLEILYLSVGDTEYEVNVSQQQSYMGLSIGMIQCDNQLDDALRPVTLYFEKSRGGEEGSEKCLRLALVKRKTDNPNFLHIEHLQVHVREFFVCADEGLLNGVLRFVLDAREHFFSSEADVCFGAAFAKPPDYRQLAAHGGRESTLYLYIEGMLINTVQFCLSFTPSPDPSGSMLREEFRGLSLLSIENASIRLSALIQNQSFGRAEDIVETIGAYYKSQLISQLYRLFFGLDLIGCPQVLFSFCGTGIRDLFYEPARGIFLGPREFVSGMGKGLQSMVKNCTYGLAYSSGKLFSSVSGALAHLSTDSEYVREHNVRRARAAPSSLGEGFLEGMKDFGSGVISGVAGAISSPAVGLLNDGLSGFAQGVRKGVLGLFVKPVVGAIDLVAMTTTGVTAMSSQDGYGSLRRHRYTRPPPSELLTETAPPGVLRPYRALGAEGREMLRTLCDGQFRGDRYVYHCCPASVSPRCGTGDPSAMPLAECTTLSQGSTVEFVMLTNRRVLFFAAKANEKACAELALHWHVPLSKISSVATSGDVLGIGLKDQKSITLGLSGDDKAQFCILLALATQHH